MKQIILNDFRTYIRNPFFVTLLIAFPILMIYLLGNLVEDIQVSDKSIGTVTVGYTSEQINLSEYSADGQIAFTQMDKENALALINKNQMDAYFDMSSNNFAVYEGTHVFTNTVLKGVANSILLNQTVFESIMREPNAQKAVNLRAAEYTQKRKLESEMSMFDYYVIAMTLMIAVFSSIAASMTFTEERKHQTMNRLITSPMNKSKIFLAKCLGQIPFAILQIVCLLIFSRALYHVNYAKTFSGKLLLFLLLFVTAATADIFGVVISLIFRRPMIIPIFIVNWIALLYSGCFAKAMTLEPLCNYLPPYIIKNAALDLNLFGNTAPAIRVIAVEILLMLGMVLLGGFVFSKKQEERV